MIETDVSKCCCAAANRLGVKEWGCIEHGHLQKTLVPLTALLLRDANAYELLERIEVAKVAGGGH